MLADGQRDERRGGGFPRLGLGVSLARISVEGVSVEAYERIKKLMAEIEEDLRKAEGGNKAAGTRVRSVMMEIKNAAQEVRQQVLEMRKQD